MSQLDSVKIGTIRVIRVLWNFDNIRAATFYFPKKYYKNTPFSFFCYLCFRQQ